MKSIVQWILIVLYIIIIFTCDLEEIIMIVGILCIIFIVSFIVLYCIRTLPSIKVFRKIEATFLKRYKKLNVYIKKYPLAINFFCKENNIEYSNSILDYNSKESLKIASQDESYFLAIEKEEFNKVNNEYTLLAREYPYGLNVAIEEFKNDDKIFLVGKKQFIIYQQRRYEKQLLNSNWVKRQSGFISQYQNAVSDLGLHSRVHLYNCNDINSNSIALQHFFHKGYIMSSFSADKLHDDILKQFKEITPEISKGELSYNEVFSNIAEIISNDFNGDLWFIVADKFTTVYRELEYGVHEEIKGNFEIKYTKLIQMMKSKGLKVTSWYDFISKNIDIQGYNIKNVIIVGEDFSLQSDFEKFCSYIQDCIYFPNNYPTIGFLSVFSQYTRSEIEQLIKDESIRIKEEQLNKQRKELMFHQYNSLMNAIAERDTKLTREIYSKIQSSDIRDEEYNQKIQDIYSEFLENYQSGIVVDESIRIVDYDIPKEYNYLNNDEYWHVQFPLKGVRIFPYRKKKINRRGCTEELFENYLNKYLTDINIVSDASLFLSEFGNFEPDIAIIYNKWRNIYIDIEIDEPYSGFSRQPIHCKDDSYDTYRNKLFLSAGWIVIRFAEEQIVRYPLSCVLVISKLLSSLDSHYIIPKKLLEDVADSNEKLQLIHKWSKNDALLMEQSHFREKYLNKSSFGFISNIQLSDEYNKQVSIEYLLSKEIEVEKSYPIPLDHKSQHYNNRCNVLTDSEKTCGINSLTDLKDKDITNENLGKLEFIKDQTYKSIKSILKNYFNSIRDSYIVHTYGDVILNNSIMRGLAVENARQQYIYEHINEILANQEFPTKFTFTYNQLSICVNAIIEINLLKDYMKNLKHDCIMCGAFIKYPKYDIACYIGYIYNEELFDFDILIENRGTERGIGILSHVLDVYNERIDIASSLKAKILEDNYGLTIKAIHCVVLDVKNNQYTVRKIKRRTSEIEQILSEKEKWEIIN